MDEIVAGGAGVYLIKVSEASKSKIKSKKLNKGIKVVPNKQGIQERKRFLLEGCIFDGFTRKPIAGSNIKFSVYSNDEKNRILLEQHRNVTSDTEGYYRINDISAKMPGKSKVSLRYNLTAEGYAENNYGIDYTENDTHVVNDFGLLPADGTALLSGWVRNIVDKAPMNDIEIEADLGEVIQDLWWDDNWWHSNEKIKVQTDKQGEYSLQANAKYYNIANRKYRNRIEPKKEEYEVAGLGIPEDGPKEESKGVFNFVYPRQNFHLFDVNAKATINGQLKDKEGRNVKDTPIKVTLVYLHQGDISEIETTTDANGNFSCEVPIKYLYVFKYWVTISTQIGEKIIKRHYERVLQPGQRERNIEDSLIHGITLHLTFSVD